MRLKLANFYSSQYFVVFSAVLLGFNFNVDRSDAVQPKILERFNHSQVDVEKPNLNLQFDNADAEQIIISRLPVLPETIELVKSFEGFRSHAYIDSSGLPVIGYGQTRVNGRTTRMGHFVTRSQADRALEQELAQIQKLVLANIKVDLNPYQLGALTSLVYNAGTVVITRSTLARKLNSGDYIGASREFVRWNKANRGGKLVVFPGLTKRRLAEQKLFLTPYGQLVSNNQPKVEDQKKNK